MRRNIKKSPLKARSRNRLFMGLFHTSTISTDPHDEDAEAGTSQGTNSYSSRQ